MSADPSSSAPLAARRPAAVAFIFVTVLFDVLALGIIIPILPKLVLGFLKGDTEHGTIIYGAFGTVWAVMQFFFAPVLGALSDRFGRRPVILISCFGLSADYVLMALAPNLGWLFVGRVISGITAANIPTAMAYIADVTPPEKRAASYGTIGAAFGVGFVVGPALGGLLGQVDPRLPFWVAAALGFANACYGFFVLPESHPVDHRRAFTWKQANPVGALRLLRSRDGLIALAAINFLCYLAHEVYPNVFVLNVDYRFHWDERTVGLTLCVVGICTILTQGLLTRVAVARLGERRVILLAMTSGTLGFLLYAAAPNSLWFWAAIPLIAPWDIAAPAMQSLMSQRLDASEQGLLQGALSSVRGITGVMGPSLFTLTFAAFIPGGWAAARGWHLAGAPFLLSATLVVIALLVAWLAVHGGKAFPAPTAEALAAAPGFTPEV